MAAQAYRDFVERVRGTVDIVPLVSEYVVLRKNGKRYVGLCPFHPEKTASFSVDEQKQLFYCFGCQAGGDAFKFVMLCEKVEFPEAARMLAEKAGIEPPRQEAAPENSDRQALLAVHRDAAAFFRRTLADPEKGARGRGYLQKRGLSSATVQALGIGYAPGSWDALKTNLLSRHPARQLLRSGMFSAREDGQGYYDRFRDRLIFPIHDASGNIVGFGGRSIDQDEPKYLNSPETPIYTKGDLLYGLNWSREAIRRAGEAVVVEGYMDYAALFEAGVRNVVATLGTAMTSAHVRLLSRYATKVTVNYDPDTAGVAAAKRSLDLLLSRGLSVRILRLDDGLDPDAAVRKLGVEAYRQALENAPACVEFLLAEAVRVRNLQDPSARVEALNEVLPHVARIEDPAGRSGYYGRIAEVIGIEDDLVLEQLKKALRTGRSAVRSSGAVSPRNEVGLPEAEVRLLRNLLESADAREETLASMPLEEIEEMATGPILRVLRDLHAERGGEISVGAVMDRLPDGKPRELLARIAFLPASERSAEEAARCAVSLRVEKMTGEKRKLQKEIDAAGPEVSRELLQKKIELSRRIDKLS